jgi:cyclic pyranopterin phosphate synthase
VSVEGKLFTCLFATTGHDLRALMRGGCSDQELSEALCGIWRSRGDRYSELRSTHTRPLPADSRKIEMSYIGG